ncbi:MAG: rRNA pseudouridine synthase [Aquificae bacterium]|nr:rRNA pseudouridine synthase [Aquificota bacterium]
MKKVRLDKFLADLGVGSRKDAKKLIKQKRVQVNSEVVSSPSIHINPETDVVYLDDQPLEYKEYYYYMFNKPQGYITATSDETMPTVMDFFQDKPKVRELFPVGRLDIDTEGLLIITNDGQLAHRLSHPKWQIEKEYYTVVKGDLSGKDFSKYEKEGLKLKDYKTKPFKLQVLSTSPDKSEIKITLTEGKYHIVKRIMETLGHPVVYLKRTRIGNLTLDENLSTGDHRELTPEEVKNLKKLVNLEKFDNNSFSG